MDKIKQFLFENGGTKQRVVKNTFWLFVGEIGSRLLKLALVIYAARVLSAAGWGVFSYALSLVGLYFVFSDAGLNSLVTREASKKDLDGGKRKMQYLSTAFYIKITLSLLALIISVIIAPHTASIHQAKLLIPLIALMMFFESIKEFGLSLNRAFERMEREALVKSINNSLIAVFGILFLAFKDTSPLSLAIAYALGSGLGTLLIFWMLRVHVGDLFGNFSRSIIGKIFTSSWSLAILLLLGSIMTNTDTVMLGLSRTATEIGWYAASQKIFQFLLIIPVMIGTATLPAFSRFAHHDNERFKRVLEKSIAAVLVIAIPIAIGSIIFGKYIILAIFGAAYLPALPTFQILIVFLLLAFPNIIINNAIFAYDKQNETIVYSAIGLVLNVGLNFLLIPPLGINGSAIATVVSWSIITILLWRKMKKINDFEFWNPMRRIVPELLASIRK